MRFKFIYIYIFLFLFSCTQDMKIIKKTSQVREPTYSSRGFALIYEDSIFKSKIVNKKLNNDEIKVLHDSLKKGTFVKITNPDNHNFVNTKIAKRANYPKIFNLVISRKIAEILELDYENPYVEFREIKKTWQ